MSEYKVPNEYYFRLHHNRPRFKNDIENVLIYMAKAISNLGELPKDEFVTKLNAAIYMYPGNATLKLKTVNNWRTEISSLFGFILQTNGMNSPGKRALELAEKEDLVEFFKYFLFSFQYPGAHIKDHEIVEQINAGINFKPASYILKVIRYACEKENKNIGLTKGEICHCIFNDLRCTRDNEDVENVWKRIKENRDDNIDYDLTGDVIRYAGDIVDYMECANLLKTYDSRTYFINSLEEETIIKFIESKEWFSKYDTMIKRKSASLAAVKDCRFSWFQYVNRDYSNTDFSTDILAYISNDKDELTILQSGLLALAEQKGTSEEIIDDRIKNESDNFVTKDIGDIGENLVHGHECMRLKLGGREDLIHLIKRIPTQFAIGYDISSVELDERKRFIEVKTTISSKPLHFNTVHLTKNEWNTADSTKDRYFVYRLMISKTERKLFLLQDPVGLYKSDKLKMVPSAGGADITFDTNIVGKFEELLSWKS